MQENILTKSVLLSVLASAAIFFGFFWFIGGFENKRATEREEYKKKDDVVAEPDVRVRVLKSDKEIIFFHPISAWERDDKLQGKIIDAVNQAAEKWQKENPEERVREIRIEEKDVPRMYSISLVFLSHKERYPYLP